jgi:hypothetical protein
MNCCDTPTSLYPDPGGIRTRLFSLPCGCDDHCATPPTKFKDLVRLDTKNKLAHLQLLQGPLPFTNLKFVISHLPNWNLWFAIYQFEICDLPFTNLKFVLKLGNAEAKPMIMHSTYIFTVNMFEQANVFLQFQWGMSRPTG